MIGSAVFELRADQFLRKKNVGTKSTFPWLCNEKVLSLDLPVSPTKAESAPNGLVVMLLLNILKLLVIQIE